MKGKSKQSQTRGRETKPQNESSDLRQREYRDKQGNIHHHTRTYQEQHKGKQED